MAMLGLGLGIRQIADTLPTIAYRILTSIDAVALGLIFQVSFLPRGSKCY